MQDQLFEYEEPKKVVVVGAGFGGLSAALQLGKIKSAERKNTHFDIIVVDRNDYQLFTPELYEIASAAKEYESEEDLKKVVCLNARVALGQQSVGFVHATVESIDPTTQHIHTSKGEIAYDYLILSPGSEPFYFGIPGMQEHSIPLKWIDDAVRIRKSIMQMLTEQKKMTVLICGAGPAGVELAAELAHMCATRPGYSGIDVKIIDRNPKPLANLSARAQQKAMKRLQRLGVDMRMECTIAEAQPGAIISDTGEKIVGDVIVWAGGVKAHHFLEKTGIPLTKRGQIAVENTLQSTQHSNVFVIGDAAEVSFGTEYAPQTAHEAVHQGPLAAYNIFALLQGKPLKTYRIHNEGFVVTMGGKYGMVVLPNDWVITGFVGWFLRRYVDFRHFRSVLPFMQACSVWYNAFKMMNKND